MLPFERFLKNRGYDPKGLLATIYAQLHDRLWKGSSSTIESWQKDCGVNFTEAHCRTIWSSSMFKTRDMNLKLQHYKLFARRYLTPDKLFHCKFKTTPLCWKGCGNKGTLVHCWWDCPQIKKFWITVIAEIKKITNYDIPNTPASLLLHFWPGLKLSKQNEDLISTMLMAAKNLIALNWTFFKVPNLSQ